MRQVLRTRSVQPDSSPGVFVAAIALIIVIMFGWLVWWTLLLILMIPPVVNHLLVGRTHRKEIVIEEDT
jgi:1,4-dihydroxy-2-naphthoate octaprenyltransferase